jgi:hypothetical protein
MGCSAGSATKKVTCKGLLALQSFHVGGVSLRLVTQQDCGEFGALCDKFISNQPKAMPANWLSKLETNSFVSCKIGTLVFSVSLNFSIQVALVQAFE